MNRKCFFSTLGVRSSSNQQSSSNKIQTSVYRGDLSEGIKYNSQIDFFSSFIILFREGTRGSKQPQAGVKPGSLQQGFNFADALPVAFPGRPNIWSF